MTEVNWMAGGPQGSGVDTAANVFSAACGYGGLYIYGKREYHSNIKGLHSYFHVRVSDRGVEANVDDVDLLAAFDAETVVRHLDEAVAGGLILIDEEAINIRVLDIPTLPIDFREEFSGLLERRGWADDLRGILGEVQKRGVSVVPVPYRRLLERVAGKVGMERSKAGRMLNVLTIGVSFGLLRYGEDLAARAVGAAFRDRPKIAEMNIEALREGYRFAGENTPAGFEHRLEGIPAEEKRILVQGHQAVALGKLLGGCRVQTYYPITPAGDESEFLEAHEVFEARTEEGEGSVLVFQTEDEIAAVNMASGAVLAGARAATSTSGPGFSLMVEGLGWAGNSEVPLVITYYQRGAPSTGLPTRHGQDDLRFAIHAGHGEFARIVLASGDIRECFYDAAAAFDYAERFQLPVIHLVDKALANSYQTYGIFDTGGYRIKRGEVLGEADLGGGPYRRFRFTESGISPRVVLGTRGGVHWYTGDEHNELGHITEHPSTRTAMVEKRMRKIELIDREVPVEEKVNRYGEDGAENMVVSWGSPKGAVLEAMGRLRGEGFSLGFLQVRMVHPLPAAQIAETLSAAEKLIDVEMNYSGQLGGIIRERVGVAADFYILKYNGRPMTATEVYEALKRALTGQAAERQVLTRGA